MEKKYLVSTWIFILLSLKCALAGIIRVTQNCDATCQENNALAMYYASNHILGGGIIPIPGVGGTFISEVDTTPIPKEKLIRSLEGPVFNLQQQGYAKQNGIQQGNFFRTFAAQPPIMAQHVVSQQDRVVVQQPLYHASPPNVYQISQPSIRTPITNTHLLQQSEIGPSSIPLSNRTKGNLNSKDNGGLVQKQEHLLAVRQKPTPETPMIVKVITRTVPILSPVFIPVNIIKGGVSQSTAVKVESSGGSTPRIDKEIRGKSRKNLRVEESSDDSSAEESTKEYTTGGNTQFNSAKSEKRSSIEKKPNTGNTFTHKKYDDQVLYLSDILNRKKNPIE